MFFPSLWAERGPVADTDIGTVGNGLGGASLFIRSFCFVAPSVQVGRGVIPGFALPCCVLSSSVPWATVASSGAAVTATRPDFSGSDASFSLLPILWPSSESSLRFLVEVVIVS